MTRLDLILLSYLFITTSSFISKGKLTNHCAYSLSVNYRPTGRLQAVPKACHDCSVKDRKGFLLSFVATGFFAATTTLTAPAFANDPSEVAGLSQQQEPPNKNLQKSSDRFDDGKPYAPLETLLPATRLKLWLETIHSLSDTLSLTISDKDSDSSKSRRYKIIQEMNSLLSNPPALFNAKEKQQRKEKLKSIIASSSSTTAQLNNNVSTVNKSQYQVNRQNFNVGDKVAAMLNQADVERQWGMLQYAEAKREETNEFRMAFNYYTKSLTFSESYLLNVSKEERKKMVRTDTLPTLSAVITSDLDRRDLFRNQFLTAIEDLTAEIAYQAKQKEEEEVEFSDAIELENAAFLACTNWFDLISPQDVRKAAEIVGRD